MSSIVTRSVADLSGRQRIHSDVLPGVPHSVHFQPNPQTKKSASLPADTTFTNPGPKIPAGKRSTAFQYVLYFYSLKNKKYVLWNEVSVPLPNYICYV